MRQIGITDAVIAALENEIAREREATPLAERLLAIGARLRAKAGSVGPPLTEEERDALWTR